MTGSAKAAGSAGTFLRGRPWENAAEFGHTHDPHEVTVQLDGVGRKFEDLLVRQTKEDTEPGAGAGDGPVFVDETGRRSRRYRRIGMVVGISCAVYAVVIVATLLSGNSDAPWLPVPGQQDEQPAGKVDTSPLPAESARPSDPPAGVVPIPGASVRAPGVAPTLGGVPVKPGASPSTKKPDPSVGPRPSAGFGQPVPEVSTPGPDPDPEPSVPVSSPPEPSPSETVVPSPDDPSPTPVGEGDGGTGTVADGPSDPTPIAESPAAPGAGGDPAATPAPPATTA
ncbi:hypothetical protein [Streptomyces graminilatus]|uniref:hypothetical protein n=1 Tax=Streptomyces graminilatus TaxID=1464070 RepID=UPI0006E455B2|nr:hypothetical protein [Streptomyces graminilatus]